MDLKERRGRRGIGGMGIRIKGWFFLFGHSQPFGLP
jgi:hypothetical protein